MLLGGDLDLVQDVTRRAEAAGFDSVWTTEFYERTAIVSLAAMSMVSSRVVLGSAIAYAVGRSPLVLSAEARDLDELSRGRLILGLGTGTRTMQRDWHGSDPTAPARRVEELVPLLRRLWSMDDTGVSHDGDFYHLALTPTAAVRPPLRADIPVYLAGVNPRMVRAAGSVADGLVGHPIFSRRYVEDVVRPALDDGAARADRSRSVPIAGYVICSINEDPDVALRWAKAQIGFYAVVRTYLPAFAVHGLESMAADARAAWSRRDIDAMIAAVPDDVVELFAVAGTPDEVPQQLHERFDGLYEQTLLYSPSFGLDAAQLQGNVEAIMELLAPGGAA
ncbi:LLM class flavin-dependent oxidoreductase [Mycobacterium cookii]|uniref:LLM class flavin-dependent oxidoreductase n=1 Tax=Nocardioides furvisabuli TaxID=375542 RepID=A0ABN2WUT1_9ACTN|nr:LLM class flavin-dependent oxidoreductase [Nocardioides furvisabuli]